MTSLVYSTGTVSVSNGSDSVIGAGSAWATALVTGGVFSCAGIAVPILSVSSDASLTLAYPWPGATATGQVYAIARETSEATRAAWTNDRLATIITKLALSCVPIDGAGTMAERDALDPPPANGFRFLIEDPTDPAIRYYKKIPGGWEGPYSITGDDGEDSIIPGPPGEGFNPAGAWVIGTVYDGGDFVSFGGRTFVSLADANTGNEPPSTDEDDAFWMFVPTAVGPPGDPGDAGDPGAPGADGNDGWSPLLALVADSARRVLQVIDWVGGEGAKPETGGYVGATGLTSTIGDAIDVRGSSGSGTGDVTTAGSVTSDRIAVYADGTGDSIKDGGKTIAELLASAGAVSSVNGAIGDVVLEADDINTTPGGPFGGEDVEAVLDDHDGRIVDLEGADIEVVTHAASSKATPAAADEFALVDSEASFGLKKFTWASFKSAMWTALGALIIAGTAKTTIVNADHFAIGDSAAGNATKKFSWQSLKAQLLTDSIIREKLTANRTYYVRTDGNDSNAGLVDNAGGAFLTIQKAINVVSALDLGTFDVNVVVADGTYTGGVVVSGAWLGSGNVILQGNVTTPANCIISRTSANCILVTNYGRLTILGFKVLTTTSGLGVAAQNGGVLTVAGLMDYGACGTAHIYAERSGVITIATNYTISGSSPCHVQALSDGYIFDVSNTITLTGTPAFSTAFAKCDRMALIEFSGNTFSGSATGVRYAAGTAGGINTFGAGATYLPGNATGVATSPGWYA